MSWSRILLRALALVAVLGAAAGLTACTLTPVYSGAAAGPTQIALTYPAPLTRLDQIVYQTLQTSFPPAAAGSGAPTLVVVTSAGAFGVAQSQTPDVATASRARVDADVILRRPGEADMHFRRFATADYNTVGQVSADTEAVREAEERAARAVAESIRLTLLGELSSG